MSSTYAFFFFPSYRCISPFGFAYEKQKPILVMFDILMAFVFCVLGDCVLSNIIFRVVSDGLSTLVFSFCDSSDKDAAFRFLPVFVLTPLGEPTRSCDISKISKLFRAMATSCFGFFRANFYTDWTCPITVWYTRKRRIEAIYMKL